MNTSGSDFLAFLRGWVVLGASVLLRFLEYRVMLASREL
jgi:hypothetical protein